MLSGKEVLSSIAVRTSINFIPIEWIQYAWYGGTKWTSRPLEDDRAAFYVQKAFEEELAYTVEPIITNDKLPPLYRVTVYWGETGKNS